MAKKTTQKSNKISQKHPSRQNIKVAVDNCIFTVINDELHVLLIQMKKKPFTGKWALPGGLIGDKETSHNAALRILNEQTAVSDVYLEQLFTFGRPDRDPFGRVVSIAYFALIPNRGINLRTISKYADVKWHKFKNLPKLAYDHDEITAYAKTRLEWKIGYTNIVWALLPEAFAFSELQKIYEAILGKKIDKRNFRKKILSLHLLKQAGKKKRGAHRPATLYTFKSKQMKMVEIL
ncbi:NUDIX hydrolase [Candidatus Parcubacteria bacterium]|nr:NUDIX hydrolase [Candidatus Parcubacteria bacterium]